MLLDKNQIDKFIPFVIKKNIIWFLMLITKSEDQYIEYDVYSVITWSKRETIGDKDKDTYNWVPDDIELYMSGNFRSSGCSHVWFGELKQSTDQHNGYIHLCSSDGWDKHIQLMSEIRDFGIKQIGNFKSE